MVKRKKRILQDLPRAVHSKLQVIGKVNLPGKNKKEILLSWWAGGKNTWQNENL